MAFCLTNLVITIGQKPLFSPISLDLSAGEVGTIMGPSGAGKSTLLAAISGTLGPDFHTTGDIQLGGRSLLGLKVQQRRVGILFQDDLLFPHLNVAQNLLFALPAGLSRKQRQQRVSQALDSAELSGFEDRDVATLSGGQRARISLVRTLLSEPDLILLDEPFAKLDLALRDQFRRWVFGRIMELKIPALLVTHDPNDCPDVAKRVELQPHPSTLEPKTPPPIRS